MVRPVNITLGRGGGSKLFCRREIEGKNYRQKKAHHRMTGKDYTQQFDDSLYSLRGKVVYKSVG